MKRLALLPFVFLLAAAQAAETQPPWAEAARKAGVVLELPRWETTPAEIEASAARAMAEGDRRLDAIAALKPDQLDFRNTLAALDAAWDPVDTTSSRLSVIKETSPDPALREAARQALQKLQTWSVDAGFRQDVYRVIKAYAATNPKLEGEDAHLLEVILRDYRRNGMDLPEEKRKTLQKLKNRLNDLELEFHRNITNSHPKVIYTQEELEGVSQEFLDRVRDEKGRYAVDANVTWQVLEVLRNVANETTRKRLAEARTRRAMESNLPIFREMLHIRARIATLLGYANWADYRIEPRMAHDGRTALEFLQRLSKGLAPKFKAELERLRAFKVADTGDPTAQIRYWDVPYYKNRLLKRDYDIDQDALKVYFEMENTLRGMFGIFEEIFGLKIRQVEAPYKWVKDLRLYLVSDAAEGTPLGLIYMDLYPRDGKYNHFAQFGITPGRRLADGRYRRPVVALICNFPPGGENRPSLLTFDDLETLFHEFGHALHSVLTQANYGQFSGTSVPRDFVEAPSQMLENWVRDKKVLDRFAVDWRDGTSHIPAEVLDRMEAARKATMGIYYRRQLAFGLLDLALHDTTDPKVLDHFVEVSNRIMSQVYLPVPEKSALIASFGHLGGGYDAGYYGYAWADAIAADMASVFRHAPGGFLDKPTGMRLRREIYAVGGSRKIEDSIRAFLGRPRSLAPFFEYIGLPAGKAAD